MKKFVKTTLLNLINFVVASLIFIFVKNIDLRFLIYVAFATIIITIIQIRINNYDGTLQIDTKNPEKDVYRLSLDGDITELPKKKIVILLVDAKADLSQK